MSSMLSDYEMQYVISLKYNNKLNQLTVGIFRVSPKTTTLLHKVNNLMFKYRLPSLSFKVKGLTCLHRAPHDSMRDPTTYRKILKDCDRISSNLQKVHNVLVCFKL